MESADLFPGFLTLAEPLSPITSRENLKSSNVLCHRSHGALQPPFRVKWLGSSEGLSRSALQGFFCITRWLLVTVDKDSAGTRGASRDLTKIEGERILAPIGQ